MEETTTVSAPAVTTEKTETTQEAPKQNNMAAIMAASGVKSDGNGVVQQKPLDIKETKTETAKDETKPPAETANEGKPETEKVEVKPELKATETSTPQKEKEEKPQLTWQEVLKTQSNTDDVLKELGFDESMVSFFKGMKGVDPKMVAFFETWKNGGDVTKYLQELTTDYSKMPAEDVMRHQLRQEYPKATPKQLDYLFQEKIIERYKLDSEDEDVLERGKLLLEAEADKHRENLVTNQQNFLLPKPPEAPSQVDNAKQLQVEQEKQRQEFESHLDNDPFVKEVFATNQIVLGEGTPEQKFKFPINAKELREVMVDPEKAAEKLFDIERDADGRPKKYTPKARMNLLVSALMTYGEPFLTEYAKHFKNLGGQEYSDSVANAKKPTDTNAPINTARATDNTPAANMAKKGVRNDGGHSS